jgi:hypothetical protein
MTQRRPKREARVIPSLPALVRHAERYGVECVYETAEGMGTHGLMSSIDVGALARHLRRIDPSWRLTTDQRERLVAQLRASGVTNRNAADMAGVSVSTVVRAGAEPCDSAPENRTVEPNKSVKSRVDRSLPVYFAFDPAWTDEPPPVKGTWRAWVYGGARVGQAGSRRRSPGYAPTQLENAA